MADFYLVITNPDVDEEDLEADILNFAEELQQQPGVNAVEMVTETAAPDGAKGIGKAVAGFLELDIAAEMAGEVISAVKEMAQGRDVEIMKKEADGSGIKVKANVNDLPAVKDFLNSLD
ncbi:hypothetical protein Lepto7376_1011 [[Leptolyngbya] sp. PCC 7376]|uniref:hypothetical protein n=1 Tax=[Leptolyngbya] sp. PCC 7376 TaxID=111781 RepID=UPI00029F307B|nr:hypothetical protein [[Leptolyngbya] sp. PCC 7376]AFY37382.1 hypothetical protein Lepto7376_1011 [[Leptolyngbya] sp. PCC 7376]